MIQITVIISMMIIIKVLVIIIVIEVIIEVMFYYSVFFKTRLLKYWVNEDTVFKTFRSLLNLFQTDRPITERLQKLLLIYKLSFKT